MIFWIFYIIAALIICGLTYWIEKFTPLAFVFYVLAFIPFWINVILAVICILVLATFLIFFNEGVQ